MNCGLLGDNHAHSPYLLTSSSTIMSSGLRLRCCRKLEWTRQHEICGDCATTSSRPRRWYLNFQRQVSLQVLENSDPDSCLQQRVSSHSSWTLHLLATLENLTPRHFDSKLHRLVSQHIGLRDSSIVTGCSACLRAPGCTRTRRRGRACHTKRDQVQRRLRLRHNYLFCSLLHSCRHRFGAAWWAENADIEQMEKSVPLITCEIAFCQHVCELVFGVNIFVLDFGV